MNANPNDGDVDNAYLDANGRKATDEERRVYTSKAWSAGDGLYYGKVRVDFENTRNALAQANARIAELEQELANKPTDEYEPYNQPQLFVKKG